MDDQIDQLRTSGHEHGTGSRRDAAPARAPPAPTARRPRLLQRRQALRDHVHPAAWFHVEQARARGHGDRHAPKKGLGHYAGTARLGAEGQLLRRRPPAHLRRPVQGLPEAAPGDAVVLTDGTTWFTYRIDKGPYKTVPTDIEVIDPVPRKIRVHGSGPLSHADHVRSGVGTQSPADRLGAPGLHTARGGRQTCGAAPLVW